jgi:hypothetical protein
MDNFRQRIKEKIKKCIADFKNNAIDFYQLTLELENNLNALDNLEKSVKNALISLSGELEIIHFTVDSDKQHYQMIIELKKFEKFLKKI